MRLLKMIAFGIVAIIIFPLLGLWMHIRHPKMMWNAYKKEYKEKGIFKMLFE